VLLKGVERHLREYHDEASSTEGKEPGAPTTGAHVPVAAR
jgi:hypothetical protein